MSERGFKRPFRDLDTTLLQAEGHKGLSLTHTEESEASTVVQADLAWVQGKENYIRRCCISTEETQSASGKGANLGLVQQGLFQSNCPQNTSLENKVI